MKYTILEFYENGVTWSGGWVNGESGKERQVTRLCTCACCVCCCAVHRPMTHPPPEVFLAQVVTDVAPGGITAIITRLPVCTLVPITYPAVFCRRCGEKIKGFSNEDHCWGDGQDRYCFYCCDGEGHPLPDDEGL